MLSRTAAATRHPTLRPLHRANPVEISTLLPVAPSTARLGPSASPTAAGLTPSCDVFPNPRCRRHAVLDPIRRFLVTLGDISSLTVQAFIALVRPPYELGAWVHQMEYLGVRSLPVAAITTLFTGMVLALQTAYGLPELGVKYYIGTVVSKTLTRELGPVLVALIVGGRIGSGMTAELGTMKVTEQIDALRSMAADPVKKLVAPKLAATLVMIPALTILGDAVGIFGGLLIGVYQLQLPLGVYVNDVTQNLTMGDVFSGVGKSFFFGLLHRHHRLLQRPDRQRRGRRCRSGDDEYGGLDRYRRPGG